MSAFRSGSTFKAIVSMLCIAFLLKCLLIFELLLVGVPITRGGKGDWHIYFYFIQGLFKYVFTSKYYSVRVVMHIAHACSLTAKRVKRRPVMIARHLGSASGSVTISVSAILDLSRTLYWTWTLIMSIGWMKVYCLILGTYLADLKSLRKRST